MGKFNRLSEQRGTLLVEAIAMLGLIALVTPTLYKKSADRLQEIQDINTASQARTMNSIVETFVKAHFPLLMDATSSVAGGTVELTYEDGQSGYFEKGYSAFVPFGFIPGDLKNYGAPRVYIHKDNDALIAYTLYPVLTDPGKKRAARLASLVGANGGMVSKPIGSEGSSHIYGTGGAWELNPAMVQELGVDANAMVENSLVVTSNEPITMSNADSDKFLYRVPPDGDGKDYHNTMVTNLFLGGHQENTGWQNNAKDFYSIYNVRKLTLNTNCSRRHIDSSSANFGMEENYCDPNVADLYVGKPFVLGNGYGTAQAVNHVNGNNGSAWFYGNLSAVNENFRLFYVGNDNLGDRTNGYDVLEFNRGGSSASNFNVIGAYNGSGSARVGMMNDFVQVVENGSDYEFLVGSSSYASAGGLIHAYKAGAGNILRLNSPENLATGSDPGQFITHISRRGGTVYINGGSSSSDKMNTYINDMGGVLSAGSSGSWIYAANNGASSRVDLLSGADGMGIATQDRRIFTVGGSLENSGGNMIYGNSSRVSLRGGKIQVFNIDSLANTMVSSNAGGEALLSYMPDASELVNEVEGATAILTKFTDIWGSVYLGNGGMQATIPTDGIYSRGNWRLGVAGSAWVDETLWARRAWLKEAGMQELHAGFSSYADWAANPKRAWLNAYSDRVSIRNREKILDSSAADNIEDTMFYIDSSKVAMRDLDGAWMELTQGNARFGSEGNYIFADSSEASSSAINMVGSSLVNIYTADDDRDGVVNIQKGAFKVSGQPDVEHSSYANIIAARAGEFTIQTNAMGSGSDDVQFYANGSDIRTRYVDFSVENNESSAIFKVMPQGENDAERNANVQVHGTFNVEGNPVIHIASNEENRAGSESGSNAHAMMEIEPSYVQIWAREHSGTDSSWGSYANGSEGGGYYAMLKINPGDISGGSSSVDDTGNASIYVRRGAIELEGSVGSGTEGSDYAADQGYGYIRANRFVSNTGEDVPSFEISGGENTTARYDQYMVNPAYTSVMHDIKLTTRGGARLSDVLPDYVLKGVYNLINDRTESSANAKVSGMDSWAHPYIGIVPFASCPPGYRNMATVVPISFNMGQAGDLIKASELGKGGGKSDRWVVNPFSRQVRIVQDGKDIAYPGLNVFSSWVFNTVGGDFTSEFAPVSQNRIEGWYWGFDAVHPDNTGSTTTSNVNTETGGSGSSRSYIPWVYQEDAGSADKVVAEALYFQQNTWLKTSVDPRSDARGWDAYMGFLYDVEQWYSKLGISQSEAPVRSNYNDGKGNETGAESLPGEYVWNFFPIPTNTLEGHATVYCYFDRGQFKDKAGWGDKVDQIDQLGAIENTGGGATFRELYQKPASDYTRRLNDPSLKYNDPW